MNRHFSKLLNNAAFIGLLVLLTIFTPAVSAQKNPEKSAKAAALFAEAENLTNRGTTEAMRASLPKLEEAIKIYRETGEKQYEADGLSRLAKIYLDLNDKAKALDSYNAALTLYKEIGNEKSEAAMLSGIGYVYFLSGEYRKALEYYNPALILVVKVGDKGGEAMVFQGMGLSYHYLNDKRTALEFYLKALPLKKEIKDQGGEAATLGIIGRVYADLGERQKALEYLNATLPLYKKLGDRRNEAAALNDIGLVYFILGDKQKALELYKQVLPIRRQVNDKKGEATTLNNIGQIYEESGDTQKALEFFSQSQNLYTEIGDKLGEAVVLNNIGRIYLLAGDSDKAFDNLKRALAITVTAGEKSAQARVLVNIGRAFALTDDLQKATDSYNQSLTLLKQVGDKIGEAKTLYYVMSFWNRQKVPKMAVFYGKQSVNLYQQLRASISGLDKNTQKIYLESIESTYRELADILINQGRIAEAEQVLAMLKEEEYLSYLRRDDSVAADLKGRISLSADEKKAFEDYEKFSDEITRYAEEFSVLEKKKNLLPLGESLSAEDQKQYDDLKAKYDAAVTVFNKYLDDLKVKFSENDKRVASVESDTQGLLKKLNQPRTVIISTIVGEDNLNLILTTSDIQKAHTVNIKAADLNKLVAEFRDAVKNPNVDPRPLGKQLYDKLFPAALQKDLKNIGADTLVWSLDGTLRYVPMAALWDGEKYLVERYTNAVLTLASRDKLNAEVTDRTKWLAFGVGVSKAFENFNALPAVPEELCSVVNDPKKAEFCKTFKETGVIKGLMLSDDEFTLQSFQNNLGKTAIVHIASHFSLNAGNETDSYLLLGGGENRRFSLDALKKTRLDNIELLTLSACNTAMTSGANSSGVEVEGFGAMAQRQGAKTILATLWAVADDSTGDLMSGFYKTLEISPKLGKAEALRKAQIVLLKGESADATTSTEKRSGVFKTGEEKESTQPKFTPDENAPFAHPYFWSPFVLIGNWK